MSYIHELDHSNVQLTRHERLVLFDLLLEHVRLHLGKRHSDIHIRNQGLQALSSDTNMLTECFRAGHITEPCKVRHIGYLWYEVG